MNQGCGKVSMSKDEERFQAAWDDAITGSQYLADPRKRKRRARRVRRVLKRYGLRQIDWDQPFFIN